VVLCTYNGATYLEEQLASICDQDRRPEEIVICDDASSDGTWDLVEKFRRYSGLRVTAHRNPENLGFAQNFGQAIGLATGEIIFLCDQDDVWLPTKIGTYETAFVEHPGLAMVFSDAEIIDRTGTRMDQRVWARDIVAFTPDERREWLSVPGAAVERLIRRNVVTGSTMAFRSCYRSLLLPIPNWDEHGVPHDAWIALLLAAVAPTLPLAEIQSLYRLHRDQRLGLNDPQPRRTDQHDLVLTRVRSQLVLAAERLALHQDRYGASPEGLRTIQDKAQHLAERLSLHGSPIRRVGPVLREVRNGRYARFSSGYRSALLDLFPLTRELMALPDRWLR
jgi:glycosyltransferase involved in cell wall biosynthesis